MGPELKIITWTIRLNSFPQFYTSYYSLFPNLWEVLCQEKKITMTLGKNNYESLAALLIFFILPKSPWAEFLSKPSPLLPCYHGTKIFSLKCPYNKKLRHVTHPQRNKAMGQAFCCPSVSSHALLCPCLPQSSSKSPWGLLKTVQCPYTFPCTPGEVTHLQLWFLSMQYIVR